MPSHALFVLVACALLMSACASAPGTALPAGDGVDRPAPMAESARSPRQSPAFAVDESRSQTKRSLRLLQSGSAEASADAAMAAAVDADAGIALGGGDVIEFRMFGQPDMNTTGYISPEGSVSLPLLEPVQVGGMTPNQAQQRIADAYRDGGFFQNPQVSITISEYRSRQISVLGQVRRPGRYPMRSRTGLLDAIAGAEGVTQQAAREVIVIRRTPGGAQRFRLNIDALVSGQADAQSFDLAGGDTVFVPEAPLFYIYGEVRRPDAYALRPGMTLIQALSTGGGLTERGSNSRIVISRERDGRSQEINARPDTVIEAQDTIYVKERFF